MIKLATLKILIPCMLLLLMMGIGRSVMFGYEIAAERDVYYLEEMFVHNKLECLEVVCPSLEGHEVTNAFIDSKGKVVATKTCITDKKGLCSTSYFLECKDSEGLWTVEGTIMVLDSILTDSEAFELRRPLLLLQIEDEKSYYLDGETVNCSNAVFDRVNEVFVIGAPIWNYYMDSKGRLIATEDCITGEEGGHVCYTNHNLSEPINGTWSITGLTTWRDCPQINVTYFQVGEPIWAPKLICGDDICSVEAGERYHNCPQDCCEADCTAIYDSTCHSTCEGYNGCDFFRTADEACDSKLEGAWVCYNATHSLACCEGDPFYCGAEYICCDGDCLTPVCNLNADCDDELACTHDICVDGGTCLASCDNPLITACQDDDGCCPEECDISTDNDCLVGCPNGVCDPWEDCDICSADCGRCDGVPCSEDADCNSTICCHEICRPSCPYCGDAYCDPGEDYIGCPSDCIAPLLHVKILSPASLESFNRGDEVSVVVQLTSNETPLLGASVVATFQIPQPLSLELWDDGVHEDGVGGDGIYGNSFKIGREVEDGFYNLSISAKKGNLTGEGRVKLIVNSTLILNLSSEKPEQERGTEIKLRGRVVGLKGAARMNSSVELVFLAEDYSFDDLVLTNSDGNFTYAYLISFADPTGDWAIKAIARDEWDNKGEAEIRIRVTPHPTLEYYDITFLAPEEERLERGSNVTIRVNVTFKGEILTNASVTFRAPNGSLIPLKEEKPGIYSYNYSISLADPLGKWRVGVSATKRIYGGGNFRIVEILPLEVFIKLIAPAERKFGTGSLIEIIATAIYASGEVVKGGKMNLRDPSGNVIFFMERDGEYFTHYVVSPEDEGIWNMRIEFEDPYGNLGYLITPIVLRKIEPPLKILQRNLPIVLPSLVASIVLLFLARSLFERKLLLRELSRLEEEKKRLIKAKKETEGKFFDRVIDEEAFRRFMRDYEVKLLDVRTKIETLREKLKRWKK